MEKLTLKTEDGFEISAAYYSASGDRYAILLHMMPATKESWDHFAVSLRGMGISSIAIDLRGHGQSTEGPDGYKEFTDVEHQKKILDVRAAWAELHQRGAKPESTAIIGASIGANLAIDHLSEHDTVRVGVAMSPGLDYHGVKSDLNIEHLLPGQHVLLVASSEDEYSYLSIQKLHQLNPSQTEKMELHDLGHGTNMIDKNVKVRDDILRWIDERL